MTPQYYTDTLQALLNRSYPSLEWALSSPPKPHAFTSLPLQSEIKDIFILSLMLLLIIIITLIIGEFNIELINYYSGTELINYPGSESVNLDSEAINYSGTAPGKRCPTCKEDGVETWVFPGRSCPICATYIS